MRVVNAMFGRGRGGLEESFLVYHEALQAGGHEVISMFDPRAAVREAIQALHVTMEPVRIWTHWDPLTVWRVGRVLKAVRPDVIVSHGNRAGRILLRASKDRWPVLARLPNFRFRRILACHGFIAILPGQVEALEQAGISRERIFHIPSMLPRLPARKSRPPLNPPVIGAMGRFHPVKGFDVLLQALSWLKQRGIRFRAVLAGDGEWAGALRQLTTKLGLDPQVQFPGWITDRASFYDGISVLCVPSREEAFARVMLEAMAHEVPLVVTDADGPRQVVQHQQTGLIVPREDFVALGHALQSLLQNPMWAQKLARQARSQVETLHTLEATVPLLNRALELTTIRHPRASRAQNLCRSQIKTC
ncbi:MAG: glycosyltransferase family 4 protein [Verrucomicrobiota bacterium]|nr:glycosyltransferase family 4 protein [Limisphaera sp.]MDW8380501.1 glycosyltransferase family 4 protein [Verrucomicrobiota bacterium]